MPVYSLVKSILTHLGWYYACLWPFDVKRHSLDYTMPVYVLTIQFTWYHAINTVWSILSLFMAWQCVEWYSLVNTMPVYGLVKSILTQFGQYSCLLMALWKSILTQFGQYHAYLWPCENQYWHSLVNTMPVYGLVKSMLTQFGQYHACLWPGDVNVGTVWSIPCLFMVWWSQCWHSLVNTMPVYGLAMSMLTQFGRYHACLWSGEVDLDTVWSIPCLFMAGLVKSILTHFGQYHTSLWSGEVNIDTVWSIPCLFMVWWSQYWHSLVNTMRI